jgi:hypothetical protein
MIKQNLTWGSAAKFYIAAVGLVVTLVADRSDLPSWVAPVIAAATAVATWLKSQQPATEPAVAGGSD